MKFDAWQKTSKNEPWNKRMNCEPNCSTLVESTRKFQLRTEDLRIMKPFAYYILTRAS